MPATLKSLGIDRLSRDERLALVQEIWDTIETEPGCLLNDAQCDELERRVAEDDAEPEKVIAWDDVKAQTVARLQRP